MELVLQGYRRVVNRHVVKARPVGHPVGTVAADAVSVFFVKKHSLSLTGDFDGHMSISASDLPKILSDSADKAPLPDLLAALTGCMKALMERSVEESGLFTHREEALLDQVTNSLSGLSDHVSRRYAEDDEEEEAA